MDNSYKYIEKDNIEIKDLIIYYDIIKECLNSTNTCY